MRMLRFGGLLAKKVQRSDLGSSWFIEVNSTVLFSDRMRTTELEPKIDRLFLKEKCLYLKEKCLFLKEKCL